MNENVIHLPVPAEPERRRRRWSLFGAETEGRHRRTPEAWAAMRAEVAAEKAARAQMQRERDQALSEANALRSEVRTLRQDMNSLGSEVRQMRALMSSQNTTTFATHASKDQAETQPISVGELFADDPFKAMRPKIRVGTFPGPVTPVTVPTQEPEPSPTVQLLARITPPRPDETEKVPHEDVTRPIPLWDSPLAQGLTAQRETA